MYCGDRLALAALVMCGAASSAHAEIIKGRVRVGPVAAHSAPASIEVVKDAAVCGHHVPDERVVAGKNGGLGNVVVSLRGMAANGAPVAARDATIDQSTCRYAPHVQAVTVGSTITLKNSDAVFHNVHARLVDADPPRTLFNVPTPFRGFKLGKPLPRSGVVAFRCDAGHSWMSAWVLVFDHPYFAVSDPEGGFSIADVPPGKYELVLWHEPTRVGAPEAGITRVVPVTVAAGKAAELDLTFEL